MPIDVVKCNSCNIVISELLAFVQNKIEVMDNESLVRICKTAFTPEDVDTAKVLLFESVPTSKRKISRKKGDGKIVKDLEDIIKLFKDTDPELIPIFVAKDLYKLPPITFDHLDCSRLLKDILVLQSDMNIVKETYALKSEVEKLKEEFISQKSSGLQHKSHEVPRNKVRASSSPLRVREKSPAISFESPIAKLTGHDPANSFAVLARPRVRKRGKKPSCVSVDIGTISQCAGIEAAAAAEAHGVTSQVTRSSVLECVDDFVSAAENCTLIDNLNSDIQNIEKKSMAEVVCSNLEWRYPKPSEEWIEVQRRRYKNRFTGNVGKASSEINSKFKAADTKIQLFISNVHKDTTEEDIKDYIQQKTQELVELERVNMKRDKGHNAFKLWVSKQKMSLYLDDKLWPEGISFRKYINFRHRIKTDTDEVNYQT